MSQLGFYINQDNCVGCRACQVACKDKHDNKVGVMFRRVSDVEQGACTTENGVIKVEAMACSLSISCNHCDEPKCVKACPTGAMHKGEDGIVSVNHKRCVGCRYCVWNCPYGAPQYNDDLGKMTKCDMCADLRAQGKKPACVGACPWGAIEYGPIDELRAKYGTVNQVADMNDATITKPNIVITPNRKLK